MPRKPKETLSSAGKREKTEAIDKPMTVPEKIRILAMSRRGMGKKAIAGETGFAMDWIGNVVGAFSCDREFCAAADKLNAGQTVDIDMISEGLGGAKRG